MNEEKTAVFLSIRDKATRLPGKSLLPLQGKTVVEHLIERLREARGPDQLIMTTSCHPGDRILADLARRCGLPCFRGSPEDKLNRYLEAAKIFGVDFMVIVDGDDVLCDPVYIDRVIGEHRATAADFVSCDGLPLGAASSGFTREALERVCRVKRQKETEVWAGYFTRTGLFRTAVVEADPAVRRPEIRMTLDYIEDYRFFQRIFAALHRPGRVFALEEVIHFLDAHPEIRDMNQEVQKLYEENLSRHTHISFELPGSSREAACGS